MPTSGVMVLHAMHNFRDDICLSTDAVDQQLELTAALSYATPAGAVSILPSTYIYKCCCSPVHLSWKLPWQVVNIIRKENMPSLHWDR
jgi:hypothetical protein